VGDTVHDLRDPAVLQEFKKLAVESLLLQDTPEGGHTLIPPTLVFLAAGVVELLDEVGQGRQDLGPPLGRWFVRKTPPF